jgi:hypothetical protein
VSLTNRAFQIDSYLDDTEPTIPWQSFYLALAVISAILLALVWLNVGVFAQIPALVVSLVLIGGFLVSAMTHYFVTRVRRKQVPAEYQRRGE